MNIFQSLAQWREERGLQNQIGNVAGNICEELTEYLRATTVEDEINALCDMVVFAINAIEAKGYNAEICMNETLKEIHSRKGDFNPELNKWEKFRTPEAMGLWYSADYRKAIK